MRKQRRAFLHSLPYSVYTATNHWRRKRREAFAYYGHQCLLCGALEGLQVHHTTYRNFGREKMRDLMPVCERCHTWIHMGVHLDDLMDLLLFRAA